jgi:ankyrin repeat protein
MSSFGEGTLEGVIGTPDPSYTDDNTREAVQTIRITHKNPYVPLCESWKTDLQRAVDDSDPDRLEQVLATPEGRSAIDKGGPDGETALHEAVKCSFRGPKFGQREPDRIKCCELLLQAGASPNSRGAFGQTPLTLAAISHYPAVEATEMLVNAKADLLMVDDFGCTALHMAAIGAHLLQLKVLLTHPDVEAAKNIRDKEGKTPLDRAKDLENKEYVTPADQECIRRLQGKPEPSDPKSWMNTGKIPDGAVDTGWPTEDGS